MGTKDVRVTLSESEHSDAKDEKGDATWREALLAGVEAVGE